MKHVAFFFFLFVLSFSLTNCSNEKQEVKSFRVNINYSPTRPEGKHHIITPDSILISFNDPQTGQPMYYARQWSDSEKVVVQQMITSWDFDDFEKQPTTASSPNCNPSFSFMVDRDGEQYSVNLYMEKITELYEFSKVIDSWLPQEVKIGYTEEYLENCQ